jgi:signal transduction histidine kinase
MRRRILLLVAAITVLVVLAFAIPLAVLIRNKVVENAQHTVLDRAQSVSLYLRFGTLSSTEIAAYLAKLPQTDDQSTSVQLPDGSVLGRPAPALPTGSHPGAPGQGNDPGDVNGPGDGPNGQQAQLMGVRGGEVAQAVVRGQDGSQYLVRVYASDAALRSGENGWWALLAGGSAALLIISLIGGELVTRRIVAPLLSTAQTAHRISAGDVTARAPTSGPREIAEVGTALNRLADRIDELIADERETVADLSHRLRTPLTTLRLDAEALRDPVEAERVGAHVSEVERMLTAVIRAARRPQREGRLPSCDATAVVGARVLFWSALADDQLRGWEVALPELPVTVRASAEDLGAAVDALLENVIAHTPEGTGFAVRLSVEANGARLVVSDDGPGLPADASVRGRSDRGSTGLGLDIARRCAEASGGSMEIGHSASGGTQITLWLNRP